MNEVEMFDTHNNTLSFALLVSGRYQLFHTLADAEAMLERIIPGGDVENSPFGSFELLTPGTGKGRGHKLSDYTMQTDLLAYAKNEEEALQLRVYGKLVPQWLHIK